jgi:signal transduction histidine kinase
VKAYTAPMLSRLSHTRLLCYAGLFTWATVGLPLLLVAIDMLESGEEGVTPMPWQGWVAWAAFGACHLWLTRSLDARRVTLFDHLVLMVMIGSAIGVTYFNQSSLGSILLIVAASLLPWLLSYRKALIWLLFGQFLIFPFLLALQFALLESIAMTLLYAGFSGFVFVTSLIGRQQNQAREEQRRLNSELRATRALLAESVRVNERTRISRELHDLLGHHLTALSLNLEVAGHLADGKVQEHVSQARTLAKLLLSDVREAVSHIRESDAIDMAASVLPLAENVPGLYVDMRLPSPFFVDDPERAHVLLRCTQEIITNVVRHAEATTLELYYRWQDEGVSLMARDNGRGADELRAGNGLRGMRERLAAYGGTVEIDTRAGYGFRLNLYLPVGQAAQQNMQSLRLPTVGVVESPLREPA